MDKKIEIKKLSHLDFDEAFSDEPSIMDRILINAAKKKDELIYSLFEEYGYSKDEVNELIKIGVIEGERMVLMSDPTIEVSYFHVHGETLFMVAEQYDSLNCRININYKKLKGETNESADY